MRLEQVAQMYGMNDYYDHCTGNIYHLSRATDGNDGMLNVPVTCNGVLIGYTQMEKVE